MAKLRKELNSSLPTGHFHIAQLHNEGELDEEKALELYNIVKQAFKEGIKGLNNYYEEIFYFIMLILYTIML